MSEYTEGAIHQLADQFERAGFTAGEVKTAGEIEHLHHFLQTLRGTHEIVPIDYVFDVSLLCQLPFDGALREVQFVCDGDKIYKLEKRGDDLYVNDKKIGLYRSKRQLNEKTIQGHELRTELDGKPEAKLPAALLDYLVEHPALWPECWKEDEEGNTIYIYFWGDIFRNSSGYLFVRYGSWHDGRVVSFCRWLGFHWLGLSPAGSLAS